MMSNVYSLSIEGVHNAEVALERAARKIAAGYVPDRASAVPEDTVEISSSGTRAANPGSSPPPDYAAEIVAVKQAETLLKANLKVFASQQKLEREILDLYA
jgi:hypothetical protein